MTYSNKFSLLLNSTDYIELQTLPGQQLSTTSTLFTEALTSTLSILPTQSFSSNLTNATSTNSSSTSVPSWLNSGRIQIPLYTTILMLSVVGNILVISTLVQNRRMRTITNLFLLNLAVSDILLGVLCMPFTLIGTLLRDFVFGEFLCKLLPFLQASSVAVSSWTLVAISCERYYAICHPLRSRSWQTLRHAYKIIAFIWISSLICMSPIAALSQLIPTSQGLRKCREQWPEDSIYYERFYNLFLDLVLLVCPLMILCAAYFLITRTLWKGINAEKSSKSANNSSHNMTMSTPTSLKNSRNDVVNAKQYDSEIIQICPDTQSSFFRSTLMERSFRCSKLRSPENGNLTSVNSSRISPSIKLKQFDSTLRRTNVAKNLQNKQRVIKMLFVLVLEFFICWTPLYVINTIALFNPSLVYQNLGYTAISFFQLLAYSSSCCNPITYCFMNTNFRKAFLDTFKGLKLRKRCSFISSKHDDDIDSLRVTINTI